MWLALSIAGVIALAGCSAGGDESGAASDDSWVEEAPSDDGYVNEEPGAGQDAGGDVDQGVDEETGGEAEAPTDEEPTDPSEPRGESGAVDPLEAAGMIFVTTATVGLQVEDPYPVLGDISAYATSHGGGRVFFDFTAATEYEGAHGIVTVKLPPSEMDAAIDHLSTYGDVMSLEENRDDITVRVTNLEARIRIAQMALDRAEQWYAAATTRQEEMELEGLLNERILALDDLLSQQAGDDHVTALSTLTVEVYSPEAAPPPPPEPEPEPETGFLAGLERGWDNFYSWGSDVLRVLGILLPWLVFLGLLVVAAYYIAKPIRKWQDSRPPRPVRPARPAGPVGPTTTMPPAGQRVVYQTAPAQPGVGQPVPQGQPAGAPRTTLSDLLDKPAPADPAKPEPPAPPA